MSLTRIANGTLVDPATGRCGIVADLWISEGRIVAPPAADSPPPDRVVDASGWIVMPGGVDIHSHIAGPKVNAARRLRPDDRRRQAPHVGSRDFRSGTTGSVPSTFSTGYLYAGLGYTTAFDAAIPPSGARHAHFEFADTPMIDRGFLMLMGNNRHALEQIAAGEFDRLRDSLAWTLRAARAYGVKIVNPGGVENWKQGLGDVETLESPVGGLKVTPREILHRLAEAVTELRLPHSVHVHCNHLGRPGNAATTLATIQALDGLRAHLTHIQFHSYGGDPNDPSSLTSRVPELVDAVRAHPHLTLDVGQVLFGDTTSMTGDSAVGAFLHGVTGRRWTNVNVELEAGCGIVPIEYREKSFVHAMQWAIGLEWFLLMEDPWRVALSTDHPNGAAFVAYPEIVQLLMSRDYRREVLARVPARVRERTRLADLEREYTLEEIAIITRAAPARMLGLPSKGHLGVGADADITIYAPSADRREMFAVPRHVFKGGVPVVEHGALARPVFGTTFQAVPAYDTAIEPHLRRWHGAHGSVPFEALAIRDDEGHATTPIAGP